jgi:hypothetical protein
MQSVVYRNTEYVRLNNWSIYAIGNEIVADRVIRYERLAEEIDEVFRTLGIPDPVALPRLRSYAKERPHYSTYYSDATRDLVARWYGREIDALNYEFESDDRRAQKASAPVAAKGAQLTDRGLANPEGAFAWGS